MFRATSHIICTTVGRLQNTQSRQIGYHNVSNDIPKDFAFAKIIWEHYSIDNFLHLKDIVPFTPRLNKGGC